MKYIANITSGSRLGIHRRTCLIGLGILIAGCGTVPPIAEVAVSKAAVSDAAGAGGAEYAPEEMTLARDKLARANQAMTARDYKRAKELAIEAQADAKLAQSKAASAKAQKAADALQDSIRVLQEELDRASSQNP